MIKRRQINAKSSQWIAEHVTVFRFDKKYIIYFMVGNSAASKSLKCRKKFKNQLDLNATIKH
jgi:hypothetical protein